MMSNSTTTASMIEAIKLKKGFLEEAEETFLILETQEHNDEAFHVLLNKFAGYIDSYAYKFWSSKCSYIPLLDIKEEAKNALWYAAMGMDFSKHARFSTYLELILRKHLNQVLASDRGETEWIARRNREIKSFVADFEAKNNRMPDPKEIAAAKDVSEDYATQWLTNHSNTTIAYDEEVCQNVADPNSSGCFVDQLLLKKSLQDALKEISGDDLDILQRYYGLPPYATAQTKKIISAETGISYYLITASLDKTLAQLKNRLLA